MPSIQTSIPINAPPSRVREVFLDFPTLPTWSKDFVKSIKTPDAKPGTQLVAGDALAVELVGMSFQPVVVSNTPDVFSWTGSLPYIFTGTHYFKFEGDGKGGTKLVQGEDFSGLMSPVMWLPFGPGASTPVGFAKFNEELKRKCETGA